MVLVVVVWVSPAADTAPQSMTAKIRVVATPKQMFFIFFPSFFYFPLFLSFLKELLSEKSVSEPKTTEVAVGLVVSVEIIYFILIIQTI
jgi:uncharacterized membrane protein (DUF485 family)